MHDYTVTKLNDQRLAQFEAEADMSRLRHVAVERRRRVRRPTVPAGLLALGIGWAQRRLAWAATKARGI